MLVRPRLGRPSPAMVVAIAALVAALTGSAVAGVVSTAVLDRQEKKQVKRIANKRITQRAPGLSVANARTLAGLEPAEFLRSSRIKLGGPIATSTEGQALILAFPDLGLEIRTDGDADIAAQIRVVNLNPLGGPEFLVTYGVDHQNQAVLESGSNLEIMPGGSIGGDVWIFARDAPGAGVLVSCGFSGFLPEAEQGSASCFGVRA